MAEVLKTSEVAAACRVSVGTVRRWVDSRELPAYRIPGGRDRRITRAALVEFMSRMGLPQQWIDEIETEASQ